MAAEKRAAFSGRATYRLLFLLHTSGHLRDRPVDGVVLGQVRQVHGIVDRQWFGGIESPCSEREFTHGRQKAASEWARKRPPKMPLDGEWGALLHMSR